MANAPGGSHSKRNPPYDHKIVKCGCKADANGNTKGALFQDKEHGPGMRYANGCTGGYRCMVCGKVHPDKG